MVRADWLLLTVTAQPDLPIAPVRLQKGLFLLAMEAPVPVDERYVFEPYSYGPMSRAVYRDAQALVTAGSLERVPVAGFDWRALLPTVAGESRAQSLPRSAAAEARRVRELVDARTFTELLEYVYDRYPEYATRSVFRRR